MVKIDAMLEQLYERGCLHIIEMIFSYLDFRELYIISNISFKWKDVILRCNIWKSKLMTNYKILRLWKRIIDRQGWTEILFKTGPDSYEDLERYEEMYGLIVVIIIRMSSGWKDDICSKKLIYILGVGHDDTVLAIEFDDQKIIVGLQKSQIKVFDRRTFELQAILEGHSDSVSCLSFDDIALYSGSLDYTIRVWDLKTWEVLNILTHPQSPIKQVTCYKDTLITCSHDTEVVVMNLISPSNISIRNVLRGHETNVICFVVDDKFLCSGSNDGTISVWPTPFNKGFRSLVGHETSIVNLNFYRKHLLSSSKDGKIFMWNLQTGAIFKVLRSFYALPNTVHFMRNFHVLPSGVVRLRYDDELVEFESTLLNENCSFKSQTLYYQGDESTSIRGGNNMFVVRDYLAFLNCTLFPIELKGIETKKSISRWPSDEEEDD